ncbi:MULTISPECIES: hypothetical protein [unclassified Pseudomonas]|uniref:hypothetical protein n=1 Tax=unclassified Pseudomonas TaxID=196821 RepID=UPI001481E449|nr:MULTISPECIES: hypothetical protein [unclassified Pseudomonas]MDI2144471.1 hypothetical protein [Pseudomonas sp. ITA]
MILDKALGAIRMPQKFLLLVSQLQKPLENPGDIPHPIPRFSNPAGLPRKWGKPG